ncbi:MAG TPA: histidine kinase dimerization/phosphoacceptor domain -containing protein [Xanthobacteraceae bacterium]|jgi:two-component sensor histidine kinase
MNDNTIDLGRTDEEVLTSEVSDEARLLLREFSHRINNEFTSAIGVISIVARSANDEAKVALAVVEDWLQNYALMHHALRMPEHTSRIDAARISPTTMPSLSIKEFDRGSTCCATQESSAPKYLLRIIQIDRIQWRLVL